MKESVIKHEERFPPLIGTLNTRDLGGLPLKGGGVTKSGVFLRSDVPMNLPASDLALLRSLRLKSVIDLRQPHELKRDPSTLEGSSEFEWRAISVWDEILPEHRPEDRFDLTAIYIAALDHAGRSFAEAFTALTESEGAGLFHCTAGKDRTGLLALLILEVAGVEEDAIVEDFALTEGRIGPLRERLMRDAEARGDDLTEYARLLKATPELLLPAAAHLREAHGGAANYLVKHGVKEETLALLRRRLTGA